MTRPAPRPAARPLAPPRRIRRAALLVGLALALLALPLVQCEQQRQQRREEHERAEAQPALDTVTALGRLEPVGEVITLAAPVAAAPSGQVRIRSLRVEEGDAVRRGQVVVLLDDEPRRRAELQEAEARLRLAEAQVQSARADHTSQESSLEAEVRRLEAEVRFATAEDERYGSLYASGAVSASLRDAKRLSRENLEAQRQQAVARLQRERTRSRALPRASSLEVAVAERQRQQALAAVEVARVSLEESLVRSPIDGRVLRVLGRPGEVASGGGLLVLGQTARMQAVVEVYQSDLPRVRLAQPVRLTSAALQAPLSGTVARIGAMVRRQSVVNTDPTANLDNRVVEVTVPLTPESSARAAGLTNLQVTAVIGP
ncbi:MAG: HlyD family efflux transporter periplasmic adaptor subunit [Prochlorococcaceae cyanobacterium]|jgi:HlyD family secretion protein